MPDPAPRHPEIGEADRRWLTASGPNIMAVFAYCRVSTDRQAEEGESLGTQQRQIEGYCQMQGLTLDRVFIERAVSGSKPLSTRPEGAKLLASIKPGDTVVTAKLDRMFRSATDALNICDKLKCSKISLHMIDLGGDVTGNGIGRLVFTILAAVAEAERDRIRERISVVKADQRTRSRYLGGAVPFGYRLGEGGQLQPNAPEQAAIQTMVELRRDGRSLRAISDAMAKEGHYLSHVAVGSVLNAYQARQK